MLLLVDVRVLGVWADLAPVDILTLLVAFLLGDQLAVGVRDGLAVLLVDGRALLAGHPVALLNWGKGKVNSLECGGYFHHTNNNTIIYSSAL